MGATFRGHARKTSSSTSHTFEDVSLGTAASNRLVAVFVVKPLGLTHEILDVEVGGLSLTQAIHGSSVRGTLWYRIIPSGTTADIVITLDTACEVAIHVWTGFTANATPISEGEEDITTGGVDIPASNGGFIVSGWWFINTTLSSVDWDFDWTGSESATVHDRQDGWAPSSLSGKYAHYQAAVINPLSTYSTGDISFPTGTTLQKVIWASWEGESSETLDADKGSFTLTGQSAGLKRGLKLVAATSPVLLTGNNARLAAARKLAPSTASFGLTGFAANLSIAGVFSLGADRATFLLTGNAATLRVGRKLAAVEGEFALTGVAATLKKTYVPLEAEQGSFLLTGVETPLDYDAPAITEIYYNNNGTWVNVIMYVNDGGTWKIPTIYAKHNGLWTIVQRE